MTMMMCGVIVGLCLCGVVLTSAPMPLGFASEHIPQGCEMDTHVVPKNDKGDRQDCAAQNMLSCKEIRNLRLNTFMGHGMFKVTYLTLWKNQTFALRFAANNDPEHPVARKRIRFIEEWGKIEKTSLCHRGMVQLMGKCDDGTIVADVEELLYPFDLVEAELDSRNNHLEQLWCWPMKWMLDIVDEIVFFSRRGLLVKSQLYEKKPEFGVSSISGTLKQPDLGKVGVVGETLLKVWERNRCICTKPPCPTPSFRCAQMMQTEDWIRESCGSTTSRVPSACENFCNQSHFLGMEKLLFSYIMRTFGAFLMNMPPMKYHPITAEVRAFFTHESYLDFPLPHKSLYYLESLWQRYHGDECIRSTYDEFMESLKKRMLEVDRGVYLEKAIGRRLWEMYEKKR